MNFISEQCLNAKCKREIVFNSSSINPSGPIYGMQQCKCNFKQYFIPCLCDKIEISPNPFFEGQLVKFPCKCKSIQIVKCPRQQCNKHIYFSGAEPYKMCETIECPHCKATCGSCKQSNYFDENHSLAEGQYFECKSDKCKDTKENYHQVINCPGCKAPQLSTSGFIPLKQNYCIDCKDPFQFMPCKRCNQMIVTNEIIIEGKFFQCKCKHRTQYFICPVCPPQKSFNLNTVNLQTPGDFGQKTCQESNNSKEHVFSMVKCSNSICKTPVKYVGKLSSTIIQFSQCVHCKEKPLGAVCKKCNHGFCLDSRQQTATQFKCPNCEEVNTNGDVQSNAPKLECKVCYEENCSMIIDSCGHLTVCENCSVNLNKNSQGLSKCPLCRVYGKLKKVFF